MTVTKIQGPGPRAIAIEFLTGRLSTGNALSRCILSSLNFNAGCITAVSAVPTNSMDFSDYAHGHPETAEAPQKVTIGEAPYTVWPIINARIELAGIIGTALKSDGDLCLLENALARVGDGWLAGTKSRLVFSDSEVYHALLSAQSDPETVIQALAEAESFPTFVGAVGRSTWAANMTTLPGSITVQQLNEFAQRASVVFVGAYDGEGYLVWRR